MKLVYISNSTYGHDENGIIKPITKGMEFDTDKAKANRLIKLGLAEKAGNTATADDKNDVADSTKGLKKADLLKLAEEKGIAVPKDATVKVLTELLEKYDEDNAVSGKSNEPDANNPDNNSNDESGQNPPQITPTDPVNG